MNMIYTDISQSVWQSVWQSVNQALVRQDWVTYMYLLYYSIIHYAQTMSL